VKIRKAVITAAGKTQRNLPLQRVIDRDGVTKSALQIVVEEAARAGAEEIAVIVCPGDETTYREAVVDSPSRLEFIPQPQPLGYGHALHCARDFVGDAPFLHLVSDHLYLSDAAEPCAKQLVAMAERQECAVSAVQATRENLLPEYGTIGGRRVAQTRNLYEIDDVREKPTPTEAEQHLIVPGLRAGHYLCFFGMHVLTPLVLEILDAAVAALGQRAAGSGSVQLSPALAELARRERYLALEVAGRRYNIGLQYGLLTAQLALALSGKDRDEVLTQLLDLVARQKPGSR
jgi:UTP--glucose-1-phosphate uridylyltransferase